MFLQGGSPFLLGGSQFSLEGVAILGVALLFRFEPCAAVELGRVRLAAIVVGHVPHHQIRVKEP